MKHLLSLLLLPCALFAQGYGEYADELPQTQSIGTNDTVLVNVGGVQKNTRTMRAFDLVESLKAMPNWTGGGGAGGGISATTATNIVLGMAPGLSVYYADRAFSGWPTVWPGAYIGIDFGANAMTNDDSVTFTGTGILTALTNGFQAKAGYQSANTFWRGPEAEAPSSPYWGKIVAADLPPIPASSLTGTLPLGVLPSGVVMTTNSQVAGYILQTLGSNSLRWIPNSVDTPALSADVDATAYAVYSFNKLVSTYAGNCVRVRRGSDNAVADIGFVQGQFDMVGARLFLGTNSAYVAIWYDQSTNGFHLTETNQTKQPLLLSPSYRDNKASILFQGLDTVQSQLVFPTNLTFSSRDVSMYQVSRSHNEWANAPYYLRQAWVGMGHDVSNMAYWRNATATDWYSIFEAYTGVATASAKWIPTDCSFSLHSVCSSTSPARWRTDNEFRSTNQFSAYLSYPRGGRLNCRFDGDSSSYSAAELRTLIITHAHTAAQESQTFLLLGAIHPELPTASRTNSLWWVGDSLSAGYSNADNKDHRHLSPVFIMATNFPDTIFRCMGRGGYTVTQLDTMCATIDQMTNEVANSGVIFWGGYNDFIQGADAATVHGRIQTACLNRKTAGWKRVYVCNLIPASCVPTNYLPTINNLIRSNWMNYADGLIDMASGEWTSDKFLSDGTHLSSSGNALAASIAATSIARSRIALARAEIITSTSIYPQQASAPTAAEIGGVVGSVTNYLDRNVNGKRMTYWSDGATVWSKQLAP